MRPTCDSADLFLCPIGNQKLKLLLAVYVDDFKMAGPKMNLKEGWRIIREGIKADEPAKAGKYLGAITNNQKSGLHLGPIPWPRSTRPTPTRQIRSASWNMTWSCSSSSASKDTKS